MRVMLSVATSADNYIDDMNDERLVLSTPEDWAAIYALRASHDAIMVGGETLRRDNPSLLSKVDGADPVRVIISGRGEISSELKIFQSGLSPVLIFSNIPRPELEDFAEIICAEQINAAFVITELERRGINSLFVEGGAQILNMFLIERLADDVRIARNPNIMVFDRTAPRFVSPLSLDEYPHTEELLGGMEVSTYHICPHPSESDHIYMRRAIELSRLSPPSPSCYRVGAVLVTRAGEIFESYTHEGSPTHHAEQSAIYKAIDASADMRGAKLYASMEPCSTRSSEPVSCSELIMQYGISRVFFAIYEPSCFVCCQGAYNLRRARVRVDVLSEYGAEVLAVNKHLF